MRTRLTTVAGIMGVALLAAACSSSKSIGGDAGGTTVPASTSSVAASSTTAPPTTGPATTAPATTAAGPTTACDDSSPSAAAVQVSVVNGDWNGDGDPDSAVSWGEPTGAGADWFVRMQVNGGTSSVVALGDAGAGFVAAIGYTDVDFSLGAPDGTNRQEMVAIVGSNAAGYNLGVFGLDSSGCAFEFDDGTAGEPYVIPVHNSAAALSGMKCDGGMGSRFVVRLEASTADGTNWTTQDIRVERADENSLVEDAPIPGTLTSADAALTAYGEAECDGELLVGGGADY
jgi:hypothetical protein